MFPDIMKLIKLRDHLKTIDDSDFDYGRCISAVKINDGNICGTVGCALGHCPTIWPDSWHIVPHVDSESGYCLRYRFDGPVLNGSRSFFGLSAEQTDHLFFNNAYGVETTKEMIINRLTHFIDEERSKEIGGEWLAQYFTLNFPKRESYSAGTLFDFYPRCGPIASCFLINGIVQKWNITRGYVLDCMRLLDFTVKEDTTVDKEVEHADR